MSIHVTSGVVNMATQAESTLYTIRVVEGEPCSHQQDQQCHHIPSHTGLVHFSQQTLSHDRDLKYTTGSGSSDSLLCCVSQTVAELGHRDRKSKQKEKVTDEKKKDHKN